MVTLVVKRPPKYHDAAGCGWSSEEAARRENALQVAKKIIGDKMWGSYGYPYMMFHNLARFATVGDLKVLAATCAHYIDVLRPPIMAINSRSVGHQAGGQIVYIQTDDGKEHISKNDALNHLLREQFAKAFKLGALTAWCRLSFRHWGVNEFTPLERQEMPSVISASYDFVKLFTPKMDSYGDLDKYKSAPRDTAVVLRDTFLAMAAAKAENIEPVIPK